MPFAGRSAPVVRNVSGRRLRLHRVQCPRPFPAPAGGHRGRRAVLRERRGDGLSPPTPVRRDRRSPARRGRADPARRTLSQWRVDPGRVRLQRVHAVGVRAVGIRAAARGARSIRGRDASASGQAGTRRSCVLLDGGSRRVARRDRHRCRPVRARAELEGRRPDRASHQRATGDGDSLVRGESSPAN